MIKLKFYYRVHTISIIYEECPLVCTGTNKKNPGGSPGYSAYIHNTQEGGEVRGVSCAEKRTNFRPPCAPL